jgi:hypothetical protein
LSAASGYVILIHVDLYRISPPLAFIPLLLFLLVGYFIYIISIFDSRKLQQEFNIVFKDVLHSRTHRSTSIHKQKIGHYDGLFNDEERIFNGKIRKIKPIHKRSKSGHIHVKKMTKEELEWRFLRMKRIQNEQLHLGTVLTLK